MKKTFFIGTQAIFDVAYVVEAETAEEAMRLFEEGKATFHEIHDFVRINTGYEAFVEEEE